MTELGIAALGVLCSLLVLAFGKWRTGNPKRNRLSERLALFELPENEADIGLSEDIMARSLQSRLAITFLGIFGRLLARIIRGAGMESRRAIIEKADKGRSLTAESLLALEVFSTVLFGALAVLGAILGKPGLPQSILLIFAGLLIGARLPIFVLERMGSARVERIEAQLPDALDLITISVEAGLTIQGALRKLVETVDNDLTLEFRRALAEYDLGGNLFDTLRRRADEVVVPSLQAVTRALTQSSKLGTSLGQLLRVQSEKVRRNRRARAQERAQKAPVKMLFPMVGCIFPTIFAVLLGPAAVNLVVNH